MPTTEAGKRLLADVKACLGSEGYLGYHVTPEAIDAIEAEARAALDEDRLARALLRVQYETGLEWEAVQRDAAAIAKAYREDEGCGEPS